MIRKFGIITSNSERSDNYLDYLYSKKISPEIILHTKKKINIKNLKKFKNQKICFVPNINSKLLEKIILKSNIKYFIYSCGEATKIKNKRILKKNILHAHPGNLPEFKGSAVFFYSILLKKTIFISVIKLNKNIDEGIIYSKNKINISELKFNKIDTQLDYKRIEFIINYLKNKKEIKKKNDKFFYPYYIPHPIIRKLAEIKFKSLISK